MFKLFAILFFSSCVYCEEFCSKTSNSCSFMFGKNKTDDFCWKVYYDINNQSVCDDDAVYEENAVRTNIKNYGRLILNPFLGYSKTVFNISFVDITFRMLKVRFQEYDYLKNGSTVKYNMCMVKDFILKGSVGANDTFSYRCPWRDVNYEGRYLDFHYEYGVSKYETRKKYKFWVPDHRYLTANSKNLYFFTYLDYSDINNLTLNIVQAQKRFNVTQYKIEVIYSYKGDVSIKTSDILTADDSDLLTYSYYTSGTAGSYHFRVKPISNYCQQDEHVCEIQETPRVEIHDGSPTLLIGMVGLSLMIPIFMIVLYMWRPRHEGKSVNVLLVTVPTNDAHVLVAPSFAEYLQATYGVNVMLDINDVPRTPSRNSFDWLKQAINHVSHIIFLRSNDDLPSNRVIYQDTYVQTIHLLNPKSNPIRKKECIISFPYSSETTGISHLELVHITNRFMFKERSTSNKLMNFLFDEKVALNKTDNSAYHDLLSTIKSVENERPVNNHANDFAVLVQVSDDDDDGDGDDHSGEKDLLGDIEKNDLKNIQVEIDSNINLFGESNKELNKTIDENNADSDLDENMFYGNV